MVEIRVKLHLHQNPVHIFHDYNKEQGGDAPLPDTSLSLQQIRVVTINIETLGNSLNNVHDPSDELSWNAKIPKNTFHSSPVNHIICLFKIQLNHNSRCTSFSTIPV